MSKNPLLSLSAQDNGIARGTNLSWGDINKQATGIREGRDPLEDSYSPSGQNSSDSCSIPSSDQHFSHEASSQLLLQEFIYLLEQAESTE